MFVWVHGYRSFPYVYVVMCLSVYVEPRLPRVRSLRIFDSLRAIIAFREACDPPLLINACESEIGMLNDA